MRSVFIIYEHYFLPYCLSSAGVFSRSIAACWSAKVSSPQSPTTAADDASSEPAGSAAVVVEMDISSNLEDISEAASTDSKSLPYNCGCSVSGATDGDVPTRNDWPGTNSGTDALRVENVLGSTPDSDHFPGSLRVLMCFRSSDISTILLPVRDCTSHHSQHMNVCFTMCTAWNEQVIADYVCKTSAGLVTSITVTCTSY